MQTSAVVPAPTVVAVGDFGRAVAGRLAARLTEAQITDRVPDPGTGQGRPVVLAAGRESRAIATAIDADRTVPWWLPVVLTHPEIRVGPVFGPDVPGCYACLTTRIVANDEHPEYPAAVWEHYDRDLAAGPPGYLEHHVSIAAALALTLIHRRHGARRTVLGYGVLSGSLRSEAFVPFHDCPRWADDGQAETLSSGGRR